MKYLFLCIGLLSLFLFSQVSSEAEINQQPLKVGFILVGARSDYGWNYAHDQGRLYLEKNMPGQVKTTVVENVPESAEVERVMEKMIAQGNKVIFATSYGYLEPVLRVAARHPDVIFMHAGSPNLQPMKNVGTYFGPQHDPNYVAGIIAGRMTKTNKIGYVGGHPVPPLLVCLNAFTLGAQSVNPKVKVHIVWTNTWHDPVLEAEAAKSLIDQGVDVVDSHQDSGIAVVQTAEKNHIYCVASHADLSHLAPHGWLTGSKWNWGPLYVKFVKSILDGTWKPENIRVSSKEGVIQLSPIGKSVPIPVRNEALAVWQKVKDGRLVVYTGPIKDRNGILKILAGKKADNYYLETLDWVVPGIEGNIPKK